MQFAPDKDFTTYTIRAHQTGQIKVMSPVTASGDFTGQLSELILTRSFIISPKKLVDDWPPKHLQELTQLHIQAVLDLNPELVILGTGQLLEFPPPSLTEAMLTQGIGIEIMDTRAACRTYNVLMHEGRHVVAALIME